jgi:hypothetical protein
VIPVADQAAGNPLKIANPDPAGLLYAQFYPLPNKAMDANGHNWAQPINNKLNWSEWNVRTDYDITKGERATFRWTQDSWDNPAPNPGSFWGDSIFPTVSANWSQPSKSVMGKLTSTISNSMVNDVEFGYGHNAIITSLGGTEAGLVSQIAAAIPPSWPTVKDKNALVESAWGGLQPYGSGQTIWDIAPYGNHEDLYTIQDNLTYVRGNHTWKAGAFYSTNAKIENNNGGTDTPQLNANSVCVTTPSVNCPGVTGAAFAQTGNQLANILIPNQYFVMSENSVNATAYVHWHDFEWYLGDSWKVNRRLTVDYGFRWSFYREPYGGDNHWASFSMAAYNPNGNPQDACNGVIIVPGTTPCQNAASALANLGISLPLSNGTPGPNRSLVNQNNHDIAPRLGIAWDVFGNGKTALRLGVGQFFQRELVGPDESLARTAPFVINATSYRTLDVAAPLSSPQVSPNAAKDPRGVTPNSWQWNVSIEQEVAKNTTFQLGYVGNVGIHLTSMEDLNQVLPANWLSYAFNGLNSNRPAGNFGTIGEFARQGHSDYHALQGLFRSDTGTFGTFQAAYTWSHSIGNVELDNSSGSVNQEAWLYNGNTALDKGNSNINRPNIFVMNEVFYLPKMQGSNNFMKQVIGGWELNSIGTVESGASLSVFSNGAKGTGSSLNSLVGTGFGNSQRPLATGIGCDSGLSGAPKDQILNPAAFTLIGYAIGTIPSNVAGRGICQGPGDVNFDMQFAKSWYVREKVRIKFSMDMFNIFNHANFYGGSNITNGFTASGLLCGPAQTTCSPSNNVVSAYNAPGGFGVTNAVHPGREMQYGLKVTF